MPKRIHRPWRRVNERMHFAAPYVDGFKAWLHDDGYSPATIQEVVRMLAGWSEWAFAAGFHLDDLLAGFDASKVVVRSKIRNKLGGGMGKASLGAAALFIRYLQDQAILPVPAPAPSPIDTWPILGVFRSWMGQHRGVAETTLDLYQRIIVSLLEALGDDPCAYTAEALRAFILERTRPHSAGYAKCIANAIRVFLRFLGATGQCAPGRQYAILGVINWRLSSVPRFLGEEAVERVNNACDGEDRLRDKAVILLLARLGLRASEVAHIRFADVDWTNGRVAVSGKSRRQEWLPLTQELGDAILAYLKRGRPPLAVPELFTTDIAPLRPLSRIAVKCLVRRSFIRAGVQSSSNGAHVLRHSAATAMLRHGVSLAGVGAVLRHTSPAMTAHYAKVDFGLLSEIAQPWSGRLPC